MRCSIEAARTALLLTALTASAAAETAWHGVWQGTVGDRAVVACFSAGEARYYELKRGEEQRLERSAAGEGWREPGRNGAVWQLARDGARLTGERRLPPRKPARKGKPAPAAHEPVKLTPAPGQGDEQACDGAAYLLPRLEQQKNASRKELSWRGKLYRSYQVADGRIGGLELVFARADDPLGLRINRALQQNFREHLDWYLRCRAQSGGAQWQYRSRPTLALWSRHWLTVLEDTESFCGGGLSANGREARVYDLRVGAAVDVWNWFRDGTFRLIDRQHTLSSAGPLGRMVSELALRRTQRACRPTLEDNSWYKIWPGPSGMVFYPDLPPVASACAGEVVVPYERLLPFLTADAQQIAKELQQEFK